LVAGFLRFYNGLQSQTSPNREIESFRMFGSWQHLATRGLGNDKDLATASAKCGGKHRENDAEVI
jgi:hypothetical protein